MKSNQLTRFVSKEANYNKTLAVTDPGLQGEGDIFCFPCLRFLPSAIFSYFTENKKGWDRAPCQLPRSATALNDDDKEERVQFFSNQR